MYEEILIPTDGSAASSWAIDHAVGLASTYGARLHALYVVDSGTYASLEAGADVVMDALEREGEDATGEIAAAASEASVDVVTNVVNGTAYRTILEYTDERGIDLIVMGTHGRRGIDRYLLGSVTERVVRAAPVPVLTVRMLDEDEA